MYDITKLDEKFKIMQDKNGFRFSIDPIILVDFVKIHKKNSKILDIGTGNGIIPVLLVMKNKAFDIDGIEIQESVSNLARENIKLNNLEENIKIINEDVKKYKMGNTYDIILSNPPYMTLDGKKINETNAKAIARHEIKLNLEDLIKSAKRLLKPKGTFYLVHRSYRMIEICKILEENNFSVSRIKFAYAKKDMNSNLVLIEAQKGKKAKLEIEEPLYL